MLLRPVCLNAAQFEYLGLGWSAIDHRERFGLEANWKYLLKLGVAVFRLDYLSCCLTVLSTVLVGQKRWPGLVVAGANSLIVCVIGMRTGQLGFIPANLFCIGVYAFNLRSWVKSESES
jgi:hypothetical protein